MKTKIYGYSDDLIEIEGHINEEIDFYNSGVKNISFSDGTNGSIEYNGDWIINIFQEGEKFIKVVPCNDELPHTDEDAKGCTSYSDVLIMEEGIEWIKIGKKKYT